MLKVKKSRQVVGEIWVTDNKVDQLVKSVFININNDAVSNISEQVADYELYAKYRKEVRKDEAQINQLRYDLEDQVLAELEGDATA